MKCFNCGAELEMSAKELSSLGGIKSSLLLTPKERYDKAVKAGKASGLARSKRIKTSS